MRRLKRSGIRMCCVGKLRGTIRQTWTPLGWYLVHKNDGIKVGATYKATDEKIAKVDGFISATNESADLRKATYEESEGWYAGITADMFG